MIIMIIHWYVSVVSTWRRTLGIKLLGMEHEHWACWVLYIQDVGQMWARCRIQCCILGEWQFIYCSPTHQMEMNYCTPAGPLTGKISHWRKKIFFCNIALELILATLHASFFVLEQNPKLKRNMNILDIDEQLKASNCLQYKFNIIEDMTWAKPKTWNAFINF